MLNNILVMLSRHKYNEKEFIENYIENYRSKRSSILENEQNKEIIINSIKTFCKNLKLATSIDISNDKVFEEFLYKHISSLCKNKVRYKSITYNGSRYKNKISICF